MRLTRARREPTDRREHVVGALGPLERLRLVIVRLEVLVDRTAQFAAALVGAAAERVLREQSEEALDEVQPRRVRRVEVEMEARVLHEPTLDLRRLVGAQ